MLSFGCPWLAFCFRSPALGTCRQSPGLTTEPMACAGVVLGGRGGRPWPRDSACAHHRCELCSGALVLGSSPPPPTLRNGSDTLPRSSWRPGPRHPLCEPSSDARGLLEHVREASSMGLSPTRAGRHPGSSAQGSMTVSVKAFLLSCWVERPGSVFSSAAGSST